MIEQFYENPNKPKTAVTTYRYPNQTPSVAQQQSPYSVGVQMANGFVLSHNQYQAQRKGIDVQEYIRRDLLVQAEAKQIENLFVGDVVIYNGANAAEKKKQEGKRYRIMRFYRFYSEMDKSDKWHDDDARWVVIAREIGKEENITMASARFFVKEPKQ